MFIARSATYLVPLALAAMAEAHVYEDGRTTPPGRRKLQADGSAYPWWNKGGTWDISEHNKRQATKPAAPVEFGVRSPGATAPLPKIAFVGGTGRMGVHLCAAWANAGYHVTMCSRSKDKAQKIVDSLLAGSGYSEASTVGGAIAVPPCDATGWKLRAGVNDDAASADLIVLGTMFEQAWALLEALAPKIRGKGKTILDMTNPFLKRADGYGAGLPEDGPQSGIEYHKGKLGDDSVKWVGAYKSVLWTLILPCASTVSNHDLCVTFPCAWQHWAEEPEAAGHRGVWRRGGDRGRVRADSHARLAADCPRRHRGGSPLRGRSAQPRQGLRQHEARDLPRREAERRLVSAESSRGGRARDARALPALVFFLP